MIILRPPVQDRLANQSLTRALPVSIRNLRKSYGHATVLDDVSLEVAAGEFLTLLGPSGSGKTTLLMAIAGFTTPDSGSLLFASKEMLAIPPHKRGIGVVFQNYALFPFLSVADNVAYPLKVRGMSRAQIAQRVEAALDAVRLTGFGKRAIRDLSGGQRQRVALARAIVFEPKLILMDEPLSALDKKLREQMQVEIKALHRKIGATIIYVTHDQREALTMSDRIAVMNSAKLIQVDTPNRLYNTPCNRFVADFIGDSTILPVTLAGGQVMLAGEAIGPAPVAASGPGDAAWLVLRPERIRLDGAGGPCLSIPAVVSDALFEGDSVLITATTPTGDLIRLRRPLVDPGAVPDRGQTVRLRIACKDAIIVGDP